MENVLYRISHDDYLFKVDHYLPSAWLGHAPFLKFLMREQKPNIFVELGVHNGFSYFLGCQAIRECNLDTKSYAVDHWNGDSQAGYFDQSVYEDVLNINSSYSDFSTLMKMSFEEALTNFNDNSVDLLHIDGFHSYESVKQDFESWVSKMNINGIILLHDIHVRRDTFGVFKFWEEIKSRYKTIEFVGSHGLGVVFLGEIPHGEMKNLYDFSVAGNMPAIQGTFGSISDDVIQQSRNGIISSLIAERDGAIAERDGAIAERDGAIAERDGAVAERDGAIAERDGAIAERDGAIAERDLIKKSKIWRFTKTYRISRSYFKK